MMWLGLLLWTIGCDPNTPNCAKVLCGVGEYCRYPEEGETDSSSPVGAVPVCTAAPDTCGVSPTCDCLTCSSCDDADGLARCQP